VSFPQAIERGVSLTTYLI